MLIMDMPECCAACPAYSKDGSQICYVKYKCVHDKHRYYGHASRIKPDWCPLQEVPNKKVLTPYIGRGVLSINKLQENSYKRGFNACIDEILNEN